MKPPALDQPLLDSEGGPIDSLNLAVDRFLESRFGIKIVDTDLMRESFKRYER
jgi:acyl carrier protein